MHNECQMSFTNAQPLLFVGQIDPSEILNTKNARSNVDDGWQIEFDNDSSYPLYFSSTPFSLHVESEIT
jgi:hypothetical protein